MLSGNDSEETRVEAIERLAGDEREDALDYIISVDIFSNTSSDMLRSIVEALAHA